MIHGYSCSISVRAARVFPALSETIEAKRSGPTSFKVYVNCQQNAVGLYAPTYLVNNTTNMFSRVRDTGCLITIHQKCITS